MLSCLKWQKSMNTASRSIVIYTEQPSWKAFSSGLEKSLKCIGHYFKLSAANQPLSSSSNVLARISDIPSGTVGFVAMVLFQDLDRPQLLTQYSLLHCHQVLTLIPCWSWLISNYWCSSILHMFNSLVPSSAYKTATSLNKPISDLLSFNK